MTNQYGFAPNKIGGGFALMLCLLMTNAAAQSVALKGVSGKKALISVNGEAPRFYQEGQSASGVVLEKVETTRVRFAVGKEKFNLNVGDTRANANGQVPTTQKWAVNTSTVHPDTLQTIAAATRPTPEDTPRITIQADTLGHFQQQGYINNQPVQFLVDTGASAVAMPLSVAEKIGLDYRRGKKVAVNTAGGKVDAYQVDLAEVRLGNLALPNVQALVIDAYASETKSNQQALLLGMSFLSRVKMTTDKNTLVLEKP